MKKLPKINTSKLLKAALPYILVGLMATKLGQAYRMASGGDVLDRIFGAFLKIGEAFTNPLPSLHPFDLLVGAACGFFNGILLVAFPDLNSTIVTLGNQILFRGIAYMILEDKPITSISSSMSFLAWSKVAGIPLILIVFFIETLIFAFVIHRTKFGRSLYAIGSNAKASRFSGIRTNQIKVLVFTLSGLCAGFAGLFLISKLGSARASIAKGYEMEVIAMAILGGVSTAGGKGKVLGAVLGVFSIGFLRYGLGIVNVSSQILMIIIGALLVVAVAIPNLKEVISESASGRWIRQRVIHNKQK